MKTKYEIVASDKSKHGIYDSERIYRLIMNAFLMLNPREQKVLQLRFGINEKLDRSTEELAQELFVTRQRIIQTETKALRKLRSIFKEKSQFFDLKEFCKDLGMEEQEEVQLILNHYNGNDEIANVDRSSSFDMDEEDEYYEELEKQESTEYESPDFSEENSNISNQYDFDYEEYLGVDELLLLSNRT
jgi:hypothetical protein